MNQDFSIILGCMYLFYEHIYLFYSINRHKRKYMIFKGISQSWMISPLETSMYKNQRPSVSNSYNDELRIEDSKNLNEELSSG